MAVEYLDPRATPGIPVEPYTLRLSEPRPTLGFLANAFPDAGSFLEELAPAVEAVFPGARVVHFRKDGLWPADDQLLDAITAECHAVVTAYGH